jgi:hypothetical protein
VGGIVGYNGGGKIGACYNTSDRGSGIVGYYNSGTITNNYSLIYGNSYGTRLTAEQMRQQSSFIGFDFESVWAIDAKINGGYPYLQNVKPAWQAGAALPVKNLFPDGEIADIQILAAGGETVDICANFNFMLNRIALAAAVYDENGQLTALYRAHTNAQYAAGLALSDVPKEQLQKNMKIFIWNVSTLAPYIEAVCNF